MSNTKKELNICFGNMTSDEKGKTEILTPGQAKIANKILEDMLRINFVSNVKSKEAMKAALAEREEDNTNR